MYIYRTTETLFSKTYDLLVLNLEPSDLVDGKLQLFSGSAEMFYFTRSEFVPHQNALLVTELSTEKNQVFIFGKQGFSLLIDGESFDITQKLPKPNGQTLQNFYYGLAFDRYQHGRRFEAFTVMSEKLQDSKLMASHFKSGAMPYTTAHLLLLKKLLFKPCQRSQDTSYVYHQPTLTVLDILAQLWETSAKYIVNSEVLPKYQRISRKQHDDFPLFMMTTDEFKVNFSDFVFSSEFLSLSARIRIPGSVTINPKVAKREKLETKIPVHIFRNYAIIADGQLHQPVIAAIVSPAFYAQYVKFGILTLLSTADEDGAEKCRVLIDLRNLKIIDNSYLSTAVTNTDLLNCVVDLTKLKASRKILKHLLANFPETMFNQPTELSSGSSKMTAQQVQVLRDHGIDSSYRYTAVKTTQSSAAESESVLVDSISFYLKNVSSLPELKDVFERVRTNTKMTFAQNLVYAQFKRIRAEFRLTVDSLAEPFNFYPINAYSAQCFKQFLSVADARIRELQSFINAHRFAMYMLEKSFNAFTPISDTLSEFSDGTYTLILRQAKKRRYFNKH